MVRLSSTMSSPMTPATTQTSMIGTLPSPHPPQSYLCPNRAKAAWGAGNQQNNQFNKQIYVNVKTRTMDNVTM